MGRRPGRPKRRKETVSNSPPPKKSRNTRNSAEVELMDAVLARTVATSSASNNGNTTMQHNTVTTSSAITMMPSSNVAQNTTALPPNHSAGITAAMPPNQSAGNATTMPPSYRPAENVYASPPSHSAAWSATAMPTSNAAGVATVMPPSTSAASMATMPPPSNTQYYTAGSAIIMPPNNLCAGVNTSGVVNSATTNSAGAVNAPPGELLNPSILNLQNINQDSGVNAVNSPYQSNPLSSVCAKLGDGVPQNIREKIGRSEFIDLSCLLETWGPVADTDSIDLWQKNVTLEFNELGQPILKQKAKQKKKIESITVWTSAFLAFASIYIEYHPQRAQEVLKYMHIVRSAALRFRSASWIAYDTHFRMRMQRNPQMSWSTIDTELWFLLVVTASPRAPLWHTNQQNPQRSSQVRAANFGGGLGSRSRSKTGWTSQQPSPMSRGPQMGVCYDFNSPKGCSRPICKYDHMCSKCNGRSHSVKHCWSAVNLQGGEGK